MFYHIWTDESLGIEGGPENVLPVNKMAKKRTKAARKSGVRSGGSAGRGKSVARSGGSKRAAAVDASGKHLVIVESPTKAKTIKRYLGPGYVVMASVGHVRDLPPRNPKGSRAPVPGVNLEDDFEPTYEILSEKRKTVTDLKKAAKQAAEVWLATDLDREGEAIAWHLVHALGYPEEEAKRVVFNAITKAEIEQAFARPRPIDSNKVSAQQARRILDRIVGYQVSPLLWKKVAGGLSAGRVQSVAVRLVVEREDQIDAFVPDEFWKITGVFAIDPRAAGDLGRDWDGWLAQGLEGKARTVKEQVAWLSDNHCIKADLVEFGGKPFKCPNRDRALEAARALGFALDGTHTEEAQKAKGEARFLCRYEGHVESPPPYEVKSIESTRSKSKPQAPFITSTLQQAAANRLGFTLQRTMRIAQQLYEGVDIHGAEGQVGLITYMRTDSTHLSQEAIETARTFLAREWGESYVPTKPNFYSSSNKAAQEAHEAIRPTRVDITPQRVRKDLTEDQYKLYRLIWERYLGSQMTPAEWDVTNVLIVSRPSGRAPEGVFKASGRTLVFDGHYKAVGLPSGENMILPPLSQHQSIGVFQIDPVQSFTNPPPRYTEASLQKKLEEEGIGRPSTYAPIIQTIQDRKYVEQVAPRDRRLRATDLGVVVTRMLTEAFPKVMDVSYTRHMEDELDKIESEDHDWRQMLREFYGPFKANLDQAHETLQHAKAVTEPAPHHCAKCGSATFYRFGRNGRFLSCSTYPECDYAAPIDREGNPLQPELSDIACPICEAGMTRRVGRFGPFLGCENYPACKGILKIDPKKHSVVLPKTPALLTELLCSKCSSPMNLRTSKRGFWLSCSTFPKCRGRTSWSSVEEPTQTALETAWRKHEKANPLPQVKTIDGRVVGDDYVPQIVEADNDSASSDAA